MARQDLRLDGITQEMKEQLRALALKKFGKANVAMMVRHFVADGLATTADDVQTHNEKTNNESVKIRIQFSAPASMAKALEKRAEERLTNRSSLLQAIVNEHFNKAPLLGDELSELRKSNYELSKIGINLNQIAKILNAGGYLSKEFISESNKKINSIRPELRKHISVVLEILEKKEIIFNSKKTGKKLKTIKKKE